MTSDAIHENFIAAQMRVADLSPDAASERVGGWFLLDAAVPECPYFNRAVVTGTPDGLDVADPIHWFTGRGAPCRFILRAGADADLVAAASDAGFRVLREEPAMRLVERCPVPVPNGFAIRAVTGGPDVVRYGEAGWAQNGLPWVGVGIARTALSMPGSHLLLGTITGEPVASSLALVTGTTVGVYNVYVDPAYRRRGFGAAITWAAVEAGLRDDAELTWIGASPMGVGLYERLGFRTEYTYVELGLQP